MCNGCMDSINGGLSTIENTCCNTEGYILIAVIIIANVAALIALFYPEIGEYFQKVFDNPNENTMGVIIFGAGIVATTLGLLFLAKKTYEYVFVPP